MKKKQREFLFETVYAKSNEICHFFPAHPLAQLTLIPVPQPEQPIPRQ